MPNFVEICKYSIVNRKNVNRYDSICEPKNNSEIQARRHSC